MKREFCESLEFTKLVKNGYLTDLQVSDLQKDIMTGQGKTISQTGGYKKIRLAGIGKGKSKGKRKRGGWRVIFADYPEYCVTAIIYAYPKGEQDDLTPDQKKRLRKTKAVLDAEVKRRYGKEKTRK